MYKQCINCKINKSLDNFHKNKTRKDGLHILCKMCKKEYTKSYYLNNKDKILKLNKEYKYHNKDKNILRSQERYQDLELRLKHLIRSSKKRANLKKIDFDIDFEWLLTKYQEQNGNCKLTKQSLDLKSSQYNINPMSPSLDRIDSTKGYTKDNVRLVCSWINLSINEYGEEFFKQMINFYLKNN